MIRPYNHTTDYEGLVALYKDSSTFGGQYDEARDSEEKLRQFALHYPNKLYVIAENQKILGTVTLFEDGRAARLYRFAVLPAVPDREIQELYDVVVQQAKILGHSQILVYAPCGNTYFGTRYRKLNMHAGGEYRAYRSDIDL